MRRPFCFLSCFYPICCTTGSSGGGVRVECSTMNCSALSRARRWRTFPANDARKVRQRLARERAEQFIVEHSTLTPPPDEPIVQKVESK